MGIILANQGQIIIDVVTFQHDMMDCPLSSMSRACGTVLVRSRMIMTFATRRRAFFAGCMIIVGMGLLFLCNGQAEGVEVDGIEYDIETGISPGSLCMKNLTSYMNVSVTNKENDTVQFRLTNTFADETTQEGSIGPNQTRIFPFTRSIPKGLPLTARPYDLSIYRFYNGTQNITNSTVGGGFVFTTPQCSLVHIEASQLVFTGTEGDRLTVKFSVQNQGNIHDDYRITVQGLPKAWHAEAYENFTLTGINSDDWRDVRLVLYPSTPGRFVLNITVASIIEGPRGDQASFYIILIIEESPTERYLAMALLLGITVLSIAAYLGGLRRENRQQEAAEKAEKLAQEAKRQAEYKAKLADRGRWKP